MITSFIFLPVLIATPVNSSTEQIRLANASQLLETGKYSISEVAQKCGFSDVYHFSRYFKQTMRVTPSQFKNPVKK